jgi:peptidoglycan/xylan/chitin deacetylase (PgdA/CDA1 family)
MNRAQQQGYRTARPRRGASRGGRILAVGSLAVVLAALFLIILGHSGGGGSRSAAINTGLTTHHGSTPRTGSGAKGAGKTRTARVPILMYHVISAPPPSVSSTALYVLPSEFQAQMNALKAAGWHPVTLNQLEAYWTRGTPLPAGKPIVLTFDTGYHSQYANALPILKQLGWVGVENLQVSGLPPSEGGLTDPEIRGLLAAGWELDTQGVSAPDLISLGPTELQAQVASARQTLRQRYGVPVNWFSYPSGHYNADVIAAAKVAGFVGSTTVVPGWASSQDDRYRLPRLAVLSGTSPTALLSQIASAQSDAAPPETYDGPATG